METGEVVLFTGWRIDYPDKETWMTDEPVELLSIDRLSEDGCYPDRYTIQFIDGEEQDCTRDCLRPAFGPNGEPAPLGIAWHIEGPGNLRNDGPWGNGE